MSIPTNPAARWVLLIAYVCLMFLWGMGDHGLLEPDEGRYANMAVEMLEPEHDILEPVLSDVSHFDKPPLIYWVTGASLHLFGTNEFAARLPSFLGAFLALAGVALTALRLHGERAAWWAVLVCASTLQFWSLGRLLSPDMLLCGLCTLGAGCCLSGRTRKTDWIGWCVGALIWGLAWWDKATACLVPLLALTLALWITGRRDLLSKLRPIRLLLTIVILGAPWYILMMLRHVELQDFFFHRELAGRVFGHVDGRKGFPGFHFVAAFVLWLPWWPVAVWKTWTRPEMKAATGWKEKRQGIPFELLAGLFVLVIFSCISSKLVTYTLTGVPWLAVGVGGLLQDRRFSLKSLEGGLVMLGAVFVFGAVFALPKLENHLDINSSVRKAVETTKTRGAQAWICDRFLPGMEFYAGESVYYVNVHDLLQVKNAPGQMPKKHFKNAAEVPGLIDALGEDVWIIQEHKEAPDWLRGLLARPEYRDLKPVTTGAFKMWKVR